MPTGKEKTAAELDEAADSRDKQAAKWLTDPNFSPDSDIHTDITDLDVTEPNMADIAAEGKTSLADYLVDYVVTGRRGDQHKNKFYTNAPGTRPNSSDENPKTGNKFTRQDEDRLIDSLGFFSPAERKTLLGEKPGPLDGHSSETHGHTFLHDVRPDFPVIQQPGTKTNYDPPKDNTYNRFVYEKLKALNLYSPSDKSPFVNNPGGQNEESDTGGLFTIQRDLGHFIANDGKGGKGKNPASGQRVKVSDMTKMALAQMAVAVGDNWAAGELLQSDPSNLGATLKAIANPLEQMGVLGIPIDRLRFKGFKEKGDLANIIAAAKGNDEFLGIDASADISGRGISGGVSPRFQATPYNGTSYGQLNSFLEPFGGLVGSDGMLVIAFEAVLLLVGLSLVIGIGTPGDNEQAKVNKNKPWEMKKGSYKKANGGIKDIILHKLLRITDTDNDFNECVSAGIALLIGADPGGLDKVVGSAVFGFSAEALASLALNLVLSPSYYANMFRQIVRGVQEVIAGFRSLGGAFTSGITGIVSTIERVANSKAYLFIMIAAGVGDAALKSSQDHIPTNERLRPGLGQDTKKVVDLAVPSYRKQATRWSDGSNVLSLHTFLASRVQQAGDIASQSKLRNATPSREQVKYIEAALETEYMPFSFHDLRTHEIISLPAFITQFDDSFAVNYGSHTGYGRQDPVRTYESTERSMSFAFKMVAFNEADFDEMWYMVNKLVTMCYPQYSKGRQREYKSGDTIYKYTQPFSQIPAASPIIRLRLGDVLKSNYSEKQLRRSFDLHVVDTLAEQLMLDDAREEAIRELTGQFIKQPEKYARLKTVSQLDATQGPDSPKGGLLGAAAGTVATLLTKKKKKKKISWPAGETVSVVKFDVDNFSMTVMGADQKEINIEVVNASDLAPDTKRIKLAAERHHLVRDAKKNLDDQMKSSGDKNDVIANKFFAEDNNAIVRSFNSTRGKGMAGVITSLAFGYADYPYEIDPGRKAPKIIDVSLGFAPTHDLPLGLDYNFKMRAPSHPVGRVMQGFGDPTTAEIAAEKKGA